MLAVCAASRIRFVPNFHVRLFDAVENADDEKLLRSIRTYGILVPLTLTRQMQVIDGYRRLCAARELGISWVPYRNADL